MPITAYLALKLRFNNIWHMLRMQCSVSHSVVSDSLQPHGCKELTRLLCMGLFRQEYWHGLLFPSLEDLPDPGIEPVFPALAGGFFTH